MPSTTLFGDNNPFSIAFTIADLPIYWYAILSILGYFTAICIYLLTISKRYKLSFEVGFYYVFFALPMIILGARLWSTIIEGAPINEFFNFRNGGLAVQGGVLFGVLTAFIYFPIMLSRPRYHLRIQDGNNIYIRRPSMWLYADAIIPTILIGQAIGRWGNFFNGEIFGSPITDGQLDWLKTLMPGVYDHMTPMVGLTVNGYEHGTYFQPLFLYESFLNVIVFVVIYGFLAELRQMKAGTIASLYFVSYGIIRFITETLRDAAFKFQATYILNGLLLATGVLMFIYCQWILPKLRDYKNTTFILDSIIWLFNKEQFKKPSLYDKKYERKEASLIYFANR